MDQSSDEVIELVGGGWKGWIASTPNISIRDGWGPFAWTQIHIPKLTLGHAASLLVLQGMKLQDLFPIDAFFRYRNSRSVVVQTGLHLLLKGELSPLYASPLHITDVQLAHLHTIPEDLTREQLLQTLMQQVQ